MHIVMGLFFLVSVAVLVAVASIVLSHSRMSRFELRRRHEQGDAAAHDELKREQVLAELLSLQRATEAVLLIIVAVLAVATFGWFFGIVVGALVALIYRKLAQIVPLQRLVNRNYQPYDATMVRFVEQHPYIGKLIGHRAMADDEYQVSSREELQHIIMHSGVILSADEKKLLVSSIDFRDKTVSSIMTPRGVVVGVPHTELVGPLMLDELHKTGHSRFPVYKDDIDHIIGILHIRELLALLDKKSQTAENAMEQKVYYIREDQTLGAALAAFLKTRHHLFVVVNEYRETAGIITLEDVMEALLGREIVDEYDVHDDLRAVAEREAKSNNNPEHGVDI